MSDNQYYESIEFNVSTATTDYDVDSLQSTFLSVFGPANIGHYATNLVIRTDNTVTIKLNKTTNHAITITSNISPFTIENVEIRNIYITNTSGSTAAIKLLLTEAID